MPLCFLILPHFKSTSGGGRPGEGDPIVNWPFQLDREVKGRRRGGNNRVPLPLQKKKDALPRKIDQPEHI